MCMYGYLVACYRVCVCCIVNSYSHITAHIQYKQIWDLARYLGCLQNDRNYKTSCERWTRYQLGQKRWINNLVRSPLKDSTSRLICQLKCWRQLNTEPNGLFSCPPIFSCKKALRSLWCHIFCILYFRRLFVLKRCDFVLWLDKVWWFLTLSYWLCGEYQIIASVYNH